MGKANRPSFRAAGVKRLARRLVCLRSGARTGRVRGGLWRGMPRALGAGTGGVASSPLVGGGGNVTGFAKRPFIDSPRLKIASTLPFATSSRKNVYGIVSGDSPPGSR